MPINKRLKMASTVKWCNVCKDYITHYKELGAGHPWLCDKHQSEEIRGDEDDAKEEEVVK